MKERPILFSGPMVLALLAGQKSQTRRLVSAKHEARMFHDDALGYLDICPYGQPGDRLWCKETFYCDHCFAGDHAKTCVGCVRCSHTDADRIAQWREELYYRADGTPDFEGERVIWKPSIFMPRWASRLTLEVTEVRVQRLQEISDLDVIAEGTDLPAPRLGPDRTDLTRGYGRSYFRPLWDSITGERAGWDANPWVWAISFWVVPQGT